MKYNNVVIDLFSCFMFTQWSHNNIIYMYRKRRGGVLINLLVSERVREYERKRRERRKIKVK